MRRRHEMLTPCLAISGTEATWYGTGRGRRGAKQAGVDNADAARSHSCDARRFRYSLPGSINWLHNRVRLIALFLNQLASLFAAWGAAA
jgi:hypothetical protein